MFIPPPPPHRSITQAILKRLLPALRAFNPSLIMLSAGFDAAKGDVGNCKQLGGRSSSAKGGLDLNPDDYLWTTEKVLLQGCWKKLSIGEKGGILPLSRCRWRCLVLLLVVFGVVLRLLVLEEVVNVAKKGAFLHLSRRHWRYLRLLLAVFGVVVRVLGVGVNVVVCCR